MQRIFALVLMAFVASWCFTASAQAAGPVVLKVSYENHPGEAVDLEAKYWAKLVEERSGGKVKLELYPSSQLGTKQDVFEQAQMGMNVCVLTDPSFLHDYVPDMGILSGPYLADWDKLFKLVQTDWFKGLEKDLENKGFVTLSMNWMYGTRSLVANKPVMTPDDLKGMKLRVPTTKIQIETFKALGASPSPMPLGEVYPALTQKVIDGAENPLTVLYGQKLYEPTKNLSMIEYMNMMAGFFCGKAWADRQDPEVLVLIMQACHDAGEYSKTLVPEEDVKIIAKMESEGVKVFYPDKELFKKASRPAYDTIPEWTPNLYNDVQKILDTL